MKVAIIGMGTVGRAQAGLFAGHDLVTWDIKDGLPYPYKDIAGCDFAVICVPTPKGPGGATDLEAVLDAFSALPTGVPVLLRSTVPPGTTGQLASVPMRFVCHVPEFLHERPAAGWPRSADVPFMIVGGGEIDRAFFVPKLRAVFPGTIHECDSLTAELAKYTANLYWAAKVTFVNEMARVCQAAGGDWDDVRAAWLCDHRVSPAYTRMAGFPPGFGGACWPKDLAALIAASYARGYDPEFLECIQIANARFRKDLETAGER